jgi:hypothetical protein
MDVHASADELPELPELLQTLAVEATLDDGANACAFDPRLPCHVFILRAPFSTQCLWIPAGFKHVQDAGAGGTEVLPYTTKQPSHLGCGFKILKDPIGSDDVVASST